MKTEKQDRMYRRLVHTAVSVQLNLGGNMAVQTGWSHRWRRSRGALLYGCCAMTRGAGVSRPVAASAAAHLQPPWQVYRYRRLASARREARQSAAAYSATAFAAAGG